MSRFPGPLQAERPMHLQPSAQALQMRETHCQSPASQLVRVLAESPPARLASSPVMSG